MFSQLMNDVSENVPHAILYIRLPCAMEARWKSHSVKHEAILLINTPLPREKELISVISWCGVCFPALPADSVLSVAHGVRAVESQSLLHLAACMKRSLISAPWTESGRLGETGLQQHEGENGWVLHPDVYICDVQ